MDWLVNAVSRLLANEEREIVLGDLVELGVRGRQAVREILGLAIRRHFAQWAAWRPWVSVASIVLPLGFLLSYISRWWADGDAIYISLYATHWSSAYLDSPGARHDVLTVFWRICSGWLALIAWSWTAGYVLASLSRRTIATTAPAFCLCVLGASLLTTTTARANPYNADVFGTAYYGLFFPVLVRVNFVVWPAMYGIRWAMNAKPPTLSTALLIAAAVIALSAYTINGVEMALTLGRLHVPAGFDPGRPLVSTIHPTLNRVSATAEQSQFLRALPLLLVWPAGYIATDACRRYLRQRAAASDIAPLGDHS
jgi:hypothetical protein